MRNYNNTCFLSESFLTLRSFDNVPPHVDIVWTTALTSVVISSLLCSLVKTLYLIIGSDKYFDIHAMLFVQAPLSPKHILESARRIYFTMDFQIKIFT